MKRGSTPCWTVPRRCAATLWIAADAYRLVHGENDGLPGIRINWWSHYADVVLDSPSLALLYRGWFLGLRSALLLGIRLCYRPDARDSRDFKNVTPEPGWLSGDPPTISTGTRAWTQL